MSDGYKSATEWKQGISAALGVMPGGWNYSLDGAVEKIEDLMRDSAARERERARAANSALPEPDATNPDHVSFAAEIVGETHPKAGYRAELNDLARRLDADRAAEREREQRIEQAARAVFGTVHFDDELVTLDLLRVAARALDAAGLLRGGGRGE